MRAPVLIVPVAVGVPPVFIFVPPTVMGAPAIFTGLVQLMPCVIRLSAVPTVMFHRFVQPMVRASFLQRRHDVFA